jgi:hypothetical protein
MADNFINIFVSIILGIIAGYIIKLLLIKNNVNYHGPNSNYEKFKVYNDGDKCFMMVPKICICPIDIKN